MLGCCCCRMALTVASEVRVLRLRDFCKFLLLHQMYINVAFVLRIIVPYVCACVCTRPYMHICAFARNVQVAHGCCCYGCLLHVSENSKKSELCMIARCPCHDGITGKSPLPQRVKKKCARLCNKRTRRATTSSLRASSSRCVLRWCCA